MGETTQIGRCNVCKSTEVDELRFVNVNTGETTGTTGEEDNEWCNECEDYTTIKYTNEPT
tara:strand:+ start:88 stop:267 length:180 start_codon:yes stop_codon:yes gene_type:complete